MENCFIAIRKEYKNRNNKFEFYLIDKEKEEVTDITRHFIGYIKAIKKLTNLYVRCDYIYGQIYGMGENAIKIMFENGVGEEETKLCEKYNDKTNDLWAFPNMMEKYLKLKYVYI